MKLSADGSTLLYSTYLGGAAWDRANDVAIDHIGNAFIVGSTTSGTSFPTLLALDSTPVGNEAFVAKFDSNGLLKFSTFLGGACGDGGLAVAIDSEGNPVVVGHTYCNAGVANDYTMLNAFDYLYSGGWDLFVTKISGSGSSLLFSTYIGSNGDEYHGDVVVDSQDQIVIAGGTTATSYPSTIGSNPPGSDAVVTKLTRDGSLLQSRLIGGSGGETATAVAVDFAGDIFITGGTTSSDYPVATGATNAGNSDIYMAKLNRFSLGVQFATYIGGDGWDGSNGISLDAGGNVVVAGVTESTRFPTTPGAHDILKNGAMVEGVMTKFGAPSYGILYSTYLGGDQNDAAGDVTHDNSGNTIVVGDTSSIDFPVRSSYDATHNGGQDFFISKFSWPPPVPDGFTFNKYKPESPTGNTPFDGLKTKPTTPQGASSATVDLAQGEFVATFSLLDLVGGRGEGTSFDLTYRSMGNPGGDPRHSWGWSSNWLQYLAWDGTAYTHHTGDGRLHRYTWNAGGYDGPLGSYSRITLDSSGFVHLKDRLGNGLVFDPTNNLRLSLAYDAAGNEWSLSYAALTTTITEPNGRSIVLTFAAKPGNAFYDANGKPLMVGLSSGTWNAEILHDSRGFISGIRTQGAASSSARFTTRFAYDDYGRLNSIQDPKGQVYLLNRFDQTGRVLEQKEPQEVTLLTFPFTLTATLPGRAFSFTYAHPVGLTRVEDANRNLVDWKFLPDNAAETRVVPVSKREWTRGLRAALGNPDPTDYSTLYTFNIQDEPTRLVMPAGNVVTYLYDENALSIHARGNLIRVVREPGMVPTETLYRSLTTQYGYHPTCNLPNEIIDERGMDANYVPQNGGSQSVNRYRTVITYNSDCKVTKIEHPNANQFGNPTTWFAVGSANQDITETFTYNAEGQETEYVNPEGIKETRTYYPTSSAGKPKGYLESVTLDPGSTPPHLAQTTWFEYSDNGALQKIKDPKNGERFFYLDFRGRTQYEFGPLIGSADIQTIHYYDYNDQLVAVDRETNPGSGSFTWHDYSYDQVGRLASEKIYAFRTSVISGAVGSGPLLPPETYEIQYSYDLKGNLKARESGSGELTSYSYDERDLLLSKSGPDGGSYKYDSNGNLAEITNQRGFRTQFTYDGFGRLTRTIDARGTEFLGEFDVVGNLVRERALSGSRTLYEIRFAYDEGNRPYMSQQWKMPSGTPSPSPSDAWVARYEEFDARGLAIRSKDGRGDERSIEYDAAGRVKKASDANQQVTFTYDGNGNLATRTETGPAACPCTTQFTHDAENRLTLITNPDGTTRKMEYDGRHNLVRTEDEKTNWVETYYDLADRPWVVRRDDGGSGYVQTIAHWDPENRVVKECDAAACSDLTYEPGTRLPKTRVHPSQPNMEWSYDANGNLWRMLYESGASVQAIYDELDRRIQVQAFDSIAFTPTFEGTNLQTFTYDPLGRIISATDTSDFMANGREILRVTPITFTYDTAGNLVGESQILPTLAVDHSVDGEGNPLTSLYPSGLSSSGQPTPRRAVHRTYDAAGQLKAVYDAKGGIADYTYGGALVKQKILGGASASGRIVSDIVYDKLHRPTDITHKNSAGATLLGFKEGYDVVGNRIAQRHLPDTSQSQRFILDDLSRTDRWERVTLDTSLAPVGSPSRFVDWTISGQNNWDSYQHGTPGSFVTCNRTTPTATGFSENCGTGTPVKNYVRDINGNLGEDNNHKYTYDFMNRLIKVEKSNGAFVAGYTYDAVGRRTAIFLPGSEVSTPAGPQKQPPLETWYTYDGAHLVQESRPLPNGQAAHILRQWTYGEGIDEQLEMTVDTNQNQILGEAADRRVFYMHDGLGSVVGLAEQSPARVVEKYTYEPYGGVTVWTSACAGCPFVSLAQPVSPSGNIWFFTGRQFESNTGLYHYRAREYHPAMGQFMQVDPLGAWGDAGNLGNPYAYVGNNPSTFRDPSGLIFETPWDAANCALGISETNNDFNNGEWGWGILSALGAALDCTATAVPVIPGGFSAGIKLGRTIGRAIDTADTAVDAARMANRAENGLDTARVAGKTDDARDGARGLDNGPTCVGNSFLPPTLVAMADGSLKEIWQVQIGDLVWATDPVTGESGPRAVLDLIMGHGLKQLVVISIDGHQVTATDGHPFWVEGLDAWVDAGNLQAGYQVLSADGAVLTIDSVVSYEAVERVHNLHVEGLHTYYVQFGDDSVLVHNTNPGCTLWRGAAEGDVPHTMVRPQDIAVDPSTGFVLPGSGISLWDDVGKLPKGLRGGARPFDQASVPGNLQVRPFGKPGHYVVGPADGVSMTPDELRFASIWMGTK